MSENITGMTNDYQNNAKKSPCNWNISGDNISLLSGDFIATCLPSIAPMQCRRVHIS